MAYFKVKKNPPAMVETPTERSNKGNIMSLAQFVGVEIA